MIEECIGIPLLVACNNRVRRCSAAPVWSRKAHWMSLTGTPLLLLLAVVFVAGTVLLIVFWKVLAPNRVLPIIGRLISLIVLNVLVLLIAAVALNDQYLFYVDWNDLFGNSTSAVVAVGRAGAAPVSVFQTTPASTGATPAVGPFPISPAPISGLPSLPPSAGPNNRLLTFQVTGVQSGLQGEVMVLLPVSYFAKGMTTHKYPVLIAPPTYPGSPEALFRNFDLQNGLTAAVSKKRIADTILVVPQTAFTGAPDSECVNYPQGLPQADTWISADVPTWVANHFRVVADRASWATIGVSAGAWCASMMSFLHPDTFAAAVSLSGYFYPKFDSNPPYPRMSPQLEPYNLEKLAGAAPASIAMLVQASAQDNVSYPSTARFLKNVKPPLGIDSMISATGGHRWIVWRPLLPVSLTWLGKTVPGFAP
jgi:enterochelin esterase-like enzyme